MNIRKNKNHRKCINEGYIMKKTNKLVILLATIMSVSACAGMNNQSDYKFSATTTTSSAPETTTTAKTPHTATTTTTSEATTTTSEAITTTSEATTTTSVMTTEEYYDEDYEHAMAVQQYVENKYYNHDDVPESPAYDFEYKYDAAKEGVIITKYIGWDNTVVIPSAIDGDSVKMIGEKAFANNMNVTNIVVPDTVTWIAKGAFQDMTYLKTIKLPEGLTIINERLFSNCYNLGSIEIPNTVEEIGAFSFSSCESLDGIISPSSLNTIKPYAFFCSGIKYIDFSKCLQNDRLFIGEDAFRSCNELTTLTIPANVDASWEVFVSCDGLKEVVISDGCKYLPGFNYCINLRKIEIPNSIIFTESASESFVGCNALTAYYDGQKYNYSNWDELDKAIVQKNVS